MFKKNLLLYLAILVLLLYLPTIFRGKTGSNTTLREGPVGITTEKQTYRRGKQVAAIIQNNTDRDIAIALDCPAQPLPVYRMENGEWKKIQIKVEMNCPESNILTLKPEQKETIRFTYWNHSLFDTLGDYQIRVPYTDEGEKKEAISSAFTITSEGMLGWAWKNLFYAPIFNALMFIVKIIPGHSLGFGIIILTFVIRFLLHIPSQRALESQKKMQLLQPKLEHIKEKFKGDQEKIAKETMQIWKENKVNPFGSCLPLFIQFPFLIAIFYVIRDGLNPDNIHLLYGPLREFSFTEINANFLGILDLMKVNAIVLPIIVGLLQFAQVKLSMMHKVKQKSHPLAKELVESEKSLPAQQAMMNKIMVYFLPLMIAIFTASVPAGVGLYWGTSTLYGIGQQFIVNRNYGRTNSGSPS